MKPKALSPFSEKVAEVIRAIPPGQTLSYGQVAVFAGRPGAPRTVVAALRALQEVPWWRVTRAGGGLAPQVAEEQGRRLRAEGHTIENGRIRPSVAGAAATPARRRAPRGG